MTIWSAEIKELEALHTSIKGRFPELEKELVQLIETKDANVVLLYSRRCLEVIITDLCECELKRPRKTEPLKGIIDKLHHEEKVPSHIITSMQNLNSLSTYGAHPKEFDPEQVRPVLINLTTIIKWYLKYKDAQVISKPEKEEVKDETKVSDVATEKIQKPKKRLILLLSGIALIVVIVVVALFVFDIIGGDKRIEELEKSIAVLPFINDSEDQENTYFINGIMDEVLINLQTIKDLRVTSRNSVEQYRGQDKPSTPEIAKKLNVNYIVEGSGQKYGNTFVLRVQLLEGAKDRHLWGEVYEQEIEDIKDIIRIQGQIAEAIANELKAIITPEEKQLIEKTPTTSLTAYDYYQRGKEEYSKFMLSEPFLVPVGDENFSEALERAEYLYNEALKYDSSFAQTYTGLAWIYWYRNYWNEYFSGNFMDSIRILTDIALSIDNQLSEAYTLRGNYYSETGKPDLAIAEYDKSLELNPNNWEAYYRKGKFYLYNDLVKSVDNLQKAVSLNRGMQLPELLKELGYAYLFTGFIEKTENYYQEAFKLETDSVEYFRGIGVAEIVKGNSNYAIEFYLKSYSIDSNDVQTLLGLGMCYSNIGKYDESLKYYKKYVQRLKSLGSYTMNYMHRIGYVYWQNGYKEEAEYYFNEQINYCNKMIELERSFAGTSLPYYDLAGVYAFRGEKNKAYENLRIYNNQRKNMSCFEVDLLIKGDPLFDSIRDEPEFKQIVRDMEIKCQTEHERVRKWLEEQGEL